MRSPVGWEYWVAQAGGRRTAPVPVWVAALVLPSSVPEGRVGSLAEHGFAGGLGEAGERLGNASPLPCPLSSPIKSMERGAASENEMQHVLCKYTYSTHTISSQYVSHMFNQMEVNTHPRVSALGCET